MTVMAQTNGTQTNGNPPEQHRFDPNFTQKVIDATGSKASPRMRSVTASLIRHLHDFCRENEITVDEWMKAVDLVRFPRVSQSPFGLDQTRLNGPSLTR